MCSAQTLWTTFYLSKFHVMSITCDLHEAEGALGQGCEASVEISGIVGGDQWCMAIVRVQHDVGTLSCIMNGYEYVTDPALRGSGLGHSKWSHSSRNYNFLIASYDFRVCNLKHPPSHWAGSSNIRGFASARLRTCHVIDRVLNGG